MSNQLSILIFILAVIFGIGYAEEESTMPEKIVFGTFAETNEQLRHCLTMAESVREFGGEFSAAPIRIYVPEQAYAKLENVVSARLESLRVELHLGRAPEEALSFYFARKVFAAAEAEQAAANAFEILAWIDEDTIILQEPTAFNLSADKKLAYRPVMHKNVGNFYDEPIDEFWTRIFDLLSVDQTTLFPMVTPADGDTIRPYFNAGLLIVRPEQKIMHKWADYFKILYRDDQIVKMCETDVKKRIFLHQTALVGAILNTIPREQMLELSFRYNYPLFFRHMFGAKKGDFDSLDAVITLRYDVYFKNPEPDWAQKLKGSPELVNWLARHLGA